MDTGCPHMDVGGPHMDTCGRGRDEGIKDRVEGRLGRAVGGESLLLSPDLCLSLPPPSLRVESVPDSLSHRQYRTALGIWNECCKTGSELSNKDRKKRSRLSILKPTIITKRL